MYNVAHPAADVERPEGPPRTEAWTPVPEVKLPRLTAPLRPLVDAVAGIHASVHTKLLGGFMLGALLLLGMAVLSLTVIDRMSRRVQEINLLHEKVDRARQMEYEITAQSHLRAMALLTQDETNNRSIEAQKRGFIENLDIVEQISPAEQVPFFERVRAANSRFDASSERVLALYRSGDLDGAMRLHLAEEHPVSHELEAAMRELERDSERDMGIARDAFATDRTLLTGIVGVFSGVSLVSALLLGFVLSWAFILPVRRIGAALDSLAAGDFRQRVNVPNRDEFGTLTVNLNSMSARLAAVYQQLQTMNDGLTARVETQVQELARATSLRRYLSPQLADSLLGGQIDIDGASRRRQLTIFFSDIRGFTPMSERIEPEELVDLLNQYLNEMTEIVFKHGGTLDKYIGDAIMVFFGDPVPYEDHAARAVRMAVEMREKLREIREKWILRTDEELNIGMGISTGYVTVGNIGGAARLEYTVLGNHVNLASRLTDMAGPNQILIAERTYRAVHDLVRARVIDQVSLEGVSRPVQVYEVDGLIGS